jgi:hypothetical protein
MLQKYIEAIVCYRQKGKNLNLNYAQLTHPKTHPFGGGWGGLIPIVLKYSDLVKTKTGLGR